MARRKLQKRYTKKKRNPDSAPASSAKRPSVGEVWEWVGPGTIGFAGSRLATRVATVAVSNRAPGLGKHAGAVASVGVLAAAWLLANKWRWLSKYQTPIVVGAAIASIQSLLQLYLPRVGWLVSDASADLAAGNQRPVLMTANGSQGALPGNLQPVDDDPNLYVYDDRYDGQPAQQPQQQSQQAPQGQSSASSGTPTDEELLASIEDEQSTQGLGIFAQ